MMNNVSFSGVFLLGLVCCVFFVNVIEAIAPACSEVDMKAASCVTYATGKVPNPAPACCAGLQQLAQSVKSVEDKKAICRCLKAAVKSFSGVQDKLLSQIPTSCKIKVGFPISLNTNNLSALSVMDLFNMTHHDLHLSNRTVVKW